MLMYINITLLSVDNILHNSRKNYTLVFISYLFISYFKNVNNDNVIITNY